MATTYWEGKADAVAQVTTVTVGGTLSSETFTISVGGVAIASHTDADTVIATTVAALVSAWNSSTHPYATGITAADASPDITLTADTAGVPFAVTLNTPGGSATFTQAATTAATGPNFWSEAGNWSGGSVPTAADTVYFRDSSVNVCWGLDQSAVDLDLLVVEQSYVGRIGLRSTGFATSADGDTFSTTAKPEYRDHYLKIEADRVEIGEHHTAGAPTGSGRLKLDLNTHPATVVVHNTARTPTDAGLPVVRLLANSSSTDIFVRAAPGGVGVACEEGDETSTVREVSVSALSGADTYVYTSDGVTLTTYTQNGGSGVLSAAGTVTLATVKGGTLRVEGAFLVTTVTQTGGAVELNNVPTSGAAVTTYNLRGGALDMKRSNRDRTITTFNWRHESGASFAIDPDVVTLSNGIDIEN